MKSQTKVIMSGMLALLLLMLANVSVATYTHTNIWSTDLVFGLESYSTTIGFDEELYMQSFTFNNGTSIDFTNVMLDGKNVESLSLSTQSANMTVTSLKPKRITYTVTGSGTQTVNLNSQEPKQVWIDGSRALEGAGWTYSGGVVTVTGASSSVTLSFSNEGYVYIPAEMGDFQTYTWYFRDDTWSINDFLGYKLLTTQTENGTMVESSSVYLENFTMGLKLYQVSSDGTATLLDTSMLCEVTQSGLTSGTLLNTTETLTETKSLNSTDSLAFILYQQIGSGSSNPKAVWVTQPLSSHTLNNNTWTMSYYVQVIEHLGVYYYKTFFGNSTCNTRIQNVQLEILDPWGRGLDYLSNSDFFGFIMNPYTYHLGQELFFGMIVMMLAIPAYNRYRDPRPVAILFMLFGGTGGLLTSLIPSVAMNISFVFLALGVAIMFYKLIR